MNTSQRVWFITGSSSGFGKRLVASALARGDCVIATARCLEKMQSLLSLTHAERRRLHLLQLDVTDSMEIIQKKMDQALSVWGRIDVVVNNAGYGVKSLLEEGGSLAALTQFQANVFGIMNVTNAILPHMRERRSGTVIIVGSRSAWRSDIPLIGLYSASKAAVHAIGETYAAELKPFGIRVMVVAPGSFRTEGVHKYPATIHRRHSVYDATRESVMARFTSLAGTEKGDPAKAMNLLVDIVKGEGKAKGREWPNLLVLGKDAYADVRQKCEQTMRAMEAWEDIATDLEFD